MDKLWIFGDNTSCVFDKTKERRFQYYKRFRNGVFPPSWSELLSNKLSYKLNNYAVAGQNNYDTFEWFCKMSTNFKEDDIVLIGWSDNLRFRLYDEKTYEHITIRPEAINHYPKIFNNISLNTIEEILQNRTNKKWEEEIDSWETLIKNYCELKKCKLHFWTFDKNINKPHYIGGSHNDFRQHLISIGAEDITIETNGLLNDKHFGEVGHIIQSNYFLNYLNDNITY
jgi:hypothetical protein